MNTIDWNSLLSSEIVDLCALGSWKEIRHDNTVTWLAYWNDPINSKLFKYVFLGASSSWKGQSDKEKYEKARALKVLSCFIYQLLLILRFHMIFCMIFKRTFLILEYLNIWVQNYIERIRAAYTKDFTSKDITKQQIAVATYFIDKLALRAGNEKVQV